MLAKKKKPPLSQLSQYSTKLSTAIGTFTEETTTAECIEALGEPYLKLSPPDEDKEEFPIEMLDYYNSGTEDFCHIYFKNDKFYDATINDYLKDLDIARDIGLLSDTNYWNMRQEYIQKQRWKHEDEMTKKQMAQQRWGILQTTSAINSQTRTIKRKSHRVNLYPNGLGGYTGSVR